MNARDEILARVASAVDDVRDADPDAARAALPRTYRTRDDGTARERIDRFEQRLVDLDVAVVRARPNQIAERLAAELARRRARRVVLPRGLPAAWRTRLPDVGPVPEDAYPTTLDAADATVTGCALAIADTGTIVLDGGAGQGTRAATLVPDLHLCVVLASRLVGTVPEAVARTREAAAAGAPLTWITGPSATSDVELVRVPGVHGPRRLVVLLVDDGASGS